METQQEPHRVAVVGAGRIGRRHVELVRASPRTVLSAVVDPDPRARELAAASDAVWLADLEELIGGHLPDAVIIATPNAMHRPQAEACVAAGIPVLLEKPIATTLADADAIRSAAERDAVPVLVGHHRRHSGFLQLAECVIGEGRLGGIVAVSSHTLFAKPASYFAGAPWRRAAGGGPILINLIHDVDALRMLVGDVASVHAMTAHGIRHQAAEETVAAILRFDSGALGTMLLSDVAAAPLSWELTSGEDPVYPRYAGRDSYVIAGTRGALGIPTMRLTTAQGEPSWHASMPDITMAVEPIDPLARQLDHFCDVIEGRAQPMVTARDAAESLRVTLAVAEAAAADLAP